MKRRVWGWRMKFDGILELINDLLADISSIDKKEDKKSFRRTIDSEKFKEIFDISLDKKETINFGDKVVKHVDEFEENLDFYQFSEDEKEVLRLITRRNNQVWKYSLARRLLFSSYLATMKQIFARDDIRTDKIFLYKSPYKLSTNILDALLIICEQRLRANFIIFTEIDVSKQVDFLKENDMEKLLNFFYKNLEDFYENLAYEKIEEVYFQFFKDNPTRVNDMAKFIEDVDFSRQIDLTDEFLKISEKNLAKTLTKSSYKFTSLIGFYYLEKSEQMDKADKNRLFKIILPENLEKFEQLTKKRPLTMDLIDEFLSLDKKLTKKINIDSEKVIKSRKDLNSTVARVSEFINDEVDDIAKIEEIEEIHENDFEDEEREDESGVFDENTCDFLKKLLSDGNISMEALKSYAIKEGLLASAYLNKVNEALYPYLDDQGLVVEDEKISIDPFYVDMVKELVDGKN